MENVVKCLCMLSDIGDYDAMNAEYKKFFPKIEGLPVQHLLFHCQLEQRGDRVFCHFKIRIKL